MGSTLGRYELLKKLNDAGVEFVVIDGVAAIIHGSARLTIDIDVCALLAEPNLTRIVSVLHDLHPRFRMRPDKMPMFDDPERLRGFRNLNLDTDLGTIDILSEVSGVGSYEEVLAQSEPIDVGGTICRVLTLDALIAAKRAANRPKDRVAVVELEVIRARTKGPPRDLK